MTVDHDTARQFLADNAIDRVQVYGVHHDALLVGKVLSPATFLRSLDSGFGIADFTFGIDRMGEPAFGFSAPWRSTVLGDIHLVPDLTTLRPSPSAEGAAFCLADATDVEGASIPLCGRGMVRRLTGELADRGFSSRFAFEIEGQFFEGTAGQNRERGWRNLRPFGVGGHLPYLAQDVHRLDPIMSEVCRRLEILGVPWEAWNAEAAAGQFEVNVEPAPPLDAADHVLLVRAVCKEVAEERGLSVTFMARVTEDYGNGLHVHHSLAGENGPAFHDPTGPDGLSTTARHWLAGLTATLAGSASIMAPTPNSVRRIEAFKAVPTHVTWDIDNKSTALRVLSSSPGSARIEHRMGAGDLHPHYAAAAILAGGLAGLDGQLEPPARFQKMAWGLPEGPDYPERLPADVPSALDALSADTHLRAVLGDDFVDYWIGLRRFEWLTFHTSGGDVTADGPTPWELDRYFETL
ncbi:MAG: glutamine synthetase family protein [Actinomycetota bacterium]